MGSGGAEKSQVHQLGAHDILKLPLQRRTERVSPEKTIKALEQVAQRADRSPRLVNKYLISMAWV